MRRIEVEHNLSNPLGSFHYWNRLAYFMKNTGYKALAYQFRLR
jgi:hypothetical protein